MEISSPIIKDDQLTTDVELAKRGNKQAFERLIGEHEYTLFTVAKGILKSKEDIEDAFQETIIKAYKGIINLRENKFFKTWIIRIMINECYYILKTKKRTIYLDDIDFASVEYTDNLHNIEVIDLINSLDEKLRLVTILYYYADLPQKDIGEILKIPQGTVRSRLYKAKEILRQMLISE